jgi:hypothetical protein
LERVKTDSDGQNDVQRNEVGLQAEGGADAFERVCKEIEILEEAGDSEICNETEKEYPFFISCPPPPPLPILTYFYR